MRRRFFTIAMTGVSRGLILRDRLLGWIPPGWVQSSNCGYSVSGHTIPSGKNRVDCVFVMPTERPAKAALLICHGIGEVVEHWFGVQELLAGEGVASLVFDYSGYGRSTGRIDWSQCEMDAEAAFAHMQKLAPELPASLLGFSLGSGIAAAIVVRVQPERLVLGAGFTTFQEAVRSVGVPRGLCGYAPAIWNAEESLRGCRLPVLVVHGQRDRLFPVRMGKELAESCGGTLRVIPGLEHNQPFRKPRQEYWGGIAEWLIAEPPEEARHQNFSGKQPESSEVDAFGDVAGAAVPARSDLSETLAEPLGG